MSVVKNRPNYKRQRFLLSFIRQLSSGVKITDLQKLVFLHVMADDLDYYEFVPYRYGAYSFRLDEDVDILQKNGFLTSRYESNRSGEKISVAVKMPKAIPPLEIAAERGETLLRRAYREYPYYAINSRILDQLFSEKELERFHKERQAYLQKDQILFTIGYEGRSIECFVNALLQNDVRLLCDVRKNPLSRKFGFSKKKLEHIMGSVGIQYVHIPGLGIESGKRRSLETLTDYQTLFDEYGKSMPEKQEYLEQIGSLMKRYTRLALMCYELEASKCHRHIIRDYLVQTCEVKSEDL